MIPEGNELNPTSKIYHHAQTALEHLSESNLTNAIQELESVIEKQNLHYASEYLFHSKYGVLNHNQLQTQALNELKTKEGFQVQLLDTVKPMLSVAL